MTVPKRTLTLAILNHLSAVLSFHEVQAFEGDFPFPTKKELVRRRLFTRVCGHRARGNGFKFKESRFALDIGRNFLQ